MRIKAALCLVLYLLLFSNRIYAACSQDSPNGFGSESTALTISVSTSSNVDVVPLGIYIQNNGGSAPTVTGVSGCSVTWNHRTGANISWQDTVTTSGITLDEYYAVTSSPLSACTVTVTTSGTVNAQRLTYFAFTGINSSTPFDTNASLPKHNSVNPGTTTATSVSTTAVSTTNANTCMFSFVRTAASAGTFTPPSGWSTLGSSGSSSMDFYYNVFSSTQSNITVPWSWSTAVSSAGMITDAVQASGGGSPTDTMMFMGLPR